jgi:hypothetical protein
MQGHVEQFQAEFQRLERSDSQHAAALELAGSAD